MAGNTLYEFINPYNFIPLATKCNRTTEEENRKGYTGYMDCVLETLTPLIMVDPEKGENDPEKEEHTVYPETIKVNGRAMIPGSELRGMIRKKYETLTSSCMSSAELDLPFASRFNGNMNMPGILDLTDPENVRLYKCNAVFVDENKKEQFSGIESGEKVKIKYETRQGKKLRNLFFEKFYDKGASGYVKIGEKCANKQAVHVFIKGKCEDKILNQDELYDMFLTIRDRYTDHLKETHISLNKKAIKLNRYSKKSKEEILQPVWYQIFQGNAYFSLGQNGQTQYKNRLKDLIPEEFHPCKTKEYLCEGCRMFGCISNGMASSGKVRVGDAFLKQGIHDYEEEKVTLHELASPHYENTRFYSRITKSDGTLVQDQVNEKWCVDFKSKYQGMKNGTTPFERNESVMIRGRKEYWHHEPEKKNADKTKRNYTVRPVRKGCEYEFRVYFDNITQKELEHLNMAVSLGNTYENTSNYAHKIGLGKPLGYGSVKVRITDIKYRKLEKKDNAYEYSLEQYHPEGKNLFDPFDVINLAENSDVKQAIRHMYDFTFITNGSKKYKTNTVKVEYPKTHENDNGYEWFTDNKIKSVLPFADKEYSQLILNNQKDKKR